MGRFEASVIVPQPMQQSDGFTLLGFKDWEDVNNEKLNSAITNIMEFHLEDDPVGFSARG